MSSLDYYKNKTVWITGASSGIGRQLAIELSKSDGIKLILSARNLGKLEEVKGECIGSSVNVIRLDLEDHDGIQDVFESHISHLSQVDIVFHNGGISQRSMTEDTSFDVYEKLIDVNYLGTVKLSLLLLPYFQKRNKGHFVVTSSSAGKFGVPMRSGYSASKFALHGFFEALKAELYDSNINITMICPGFIRTEISKHSLTGNGKLQGTMDEAQLNGMSVEACVNYIIRDVSRLKFESYIGGFKESKLAIYVSRYFPSLFRRIIVKSQVT